MSNKKRKQNKMNDLPKSCIEKAGAKEDICFEYGIFGLDAVDCDILRGLETEEKRLAYLKQRFPEGIL